MKKHIYRAKKINQISIETLSALLGESKAIVSVDVAKRDFAVGIANATGAMLEQFKFTHPDQTEPFLELLDGLIQRGHGPELVMEPTGTYGDFLKAQATGRGIEVYLVSPKRCHDAAEIFDGVPSLHDVKATVLLARLHVQGLSKQTTPDFEGRRDIRAAMERRELYADPLERDYGRLEALLSRYWPELPLILNPRSHKTSLELLAQYPGPERVIAHRDDAASLMRTFSRGQVSKATIEQVLQASERTFGVKMTEEEQHLLQALCRQLLELWRAMDRVDDEIRALVKTHETGRRLASMVGSVTAAVLLAYLGSPEGYASSDAYVKAMGLNLKEHSSGSSRKPGTGLHITKRGPGRVRRYLFLATLRMIQRHPLCRAWYEARSSYARGEKMKAVVALMRKLGKAIWVVGRGTPLDLTQLLNPDRLLLKKPLQRATA